jgi:hypothetical protein
MNHPEAFKAVVDKVKSWFLIFSELKKVNHSWFTFFVNFAEINKQIYEYWNS